jgi:hypothetical protein
MARHDEAKLREALAAQRAAETGVAGVGDSPLLDDPATALRKLHQMLEEARANASIYTLSGIAQGAAYFGDNDLALRALDSMSRRGYSFEIWAWIVWRPVMRDLRGEPAFKKLLRDLGIADYWRATGNWSDFCKPVGGVSNVIEILLIARASRRSLAYDAK